MPLAGRPLVEWSLSALRGAASVRAIVVACPPGTHPSPSGRTSSRIAEETATAAGGGVWEDVVAVDGGETRSRSVANALALVETELIAIHDAARPLVTPELIEGVVATLTADPEAAGAIAAIPVTDTIKRAGSERDPRPPLQHFPRARADDAAIEVAETVDRGRLWAAQTPQVFRTDALRDALTADPDAIEAATDEAMLVEAAGGRVLIHPAPSENLKVTRPLDLRVAELLLSR